MKAKIFSKNNRGPILWILSIQYYVIQFAVSLAWPIEHSYSWANNTISDLANTKCGPYGERIVCSPLHANMNISFVTLGLTMMGGAFLLRKQLANNLVANLGYIFMALAGLGTILVGLFPENTVSALHILGAALPFFLGNIGMILIGITME